MNPMNPNKNRWRRCAVCACLLTVTLASLATARAEPYKMDGTPDAGGQWKYVLVGEGAMLTEPVGTPSGDLWIPNALDGYAVTHIGDQAFMRCEGLTSVVIPDGVKEIGEQAFELCLNLTSVTIPASVTTICDEAFAATGLTSLTIPNSVTSIGTEAFLTCTGLTSITIPTSVTRMGWNPFLRCPFTFIDVSSENPTYQQMEGVLFDKQQKMLVSYPGARKGAYTVPEGVLSIGEAAFNACSGLTGVTIPEGVTSIGEGAFAWCSGLTDVKIPEGVTSIGKSAFLRCGQLTNVTIPASVTMIDDHLFASTGLTSVTIPNGVTRIGTWAFYGCAGLTSVVIPESVTSIEGNPFAECSLTFIDVLSDNPVYEQIDGVLFDKQKKTLVSYPGAREGAYTVPEGVLFIGQEAFDGCSGLASVTISDGVTSIGSWAFGLCVNLISVTIPASVTSIGSQAFNQCGEVTLSVTEGSYAERYAKDNKLPYLFIESGT